MYLHEFFWTSSTTPSCLMLVPQEAKCLNLSLCQKLYNINYYIKQFIFFPTECEQELEWLKEAGFDTIVKKYKGKNLIISTCRIQHFGVVHSYILWFVIKPPTINYLSAMATIILFFRSRYILSCFNILRQPSPYCTVAVQSRTCTFVP